jgi:hypothetical protein
MSHQDQALKLSDVKIQAQTHQRPMITPLTEVRASTPAERQKVIEGVSKIIDKHLDVLLALKDR